MQIKLRLWCNIWNCFLSLNFWTLMQLKYFIGQTYIVAKSIGFQSVMFSSSWHSYLGIFTTILLISYRITWLTTNSKYSTAHVLGKHRPIVTVAEVIFVSEVKSCWEISNKVPCPIQYWVLYGFPFRSIWKHSGNDPKSLRFPFKIADGTFPHESTTEYAEKRIKSLHLNKLVKKILYL